MCEDPSHKADTLHSIRKSHQKMVSILEILLMKRFNIKMQTNENYMLKLNISFDWTSCVVFPCFLFVFFSAEEKLIVCTETIFEMFQFPKHESIPKLKF